MPRIKKATDANGVVFYPINISKAVYDTDRNQRLNITIDNIYSILNRIAFSDIYIGIGSNVSSIMIAGNHHNIMTKGDHVSLTASGSKIWIALPNTYNPVLMMNGIQIPMTASSNVTQNNITYKVLYSTESYTGTFDVFLF